MSQAMGPSPPLIAAKASLSDRTISANLSVAGGGAWVTRNS